MKRPRATKKASARRKSPARPRRAPVPKPAAATLDAEGVEYVKSLAAALSGLMEAQGRWIPEIDAVSRQQSLVNDTDWRRRITSALAELVDAADGLRVQPVPAGMQPVDGALAQAQSEARLAGEGFAEAVDGADMRTMVAALEHIDRMNQCIQRARGLIAG